MEIFNLVEKYAESEEIMWDFLQFKPYVIMMRARAKAEKIVNPEKLYEVLKSETIALLGNDETNTEWKCDDTPHIMLIAGVNGSGKTTTLYSFLKEINKPGFKTITIENPVEYHLDNITQTQVDPDDDYTFHDGLKAAMRQDPDIIMVGEIRDDDTAKTAIQASLTGHRVFSTLHTNDAAGTFPRLVELGVKENLIGQAVNVVMAQRLIRTLCDDCKKKKDITGEDKETIVSILKDIPNPDEYSDTITKDYMYEAVGCAECNNTGYRGRIGVFEAIIIDQTVSQLVQENSSDPQIREYVSKKQKMLTLAQDGVLKVLSGISDLNELKRVIDIDQSTQKFI
jgi:type II secretory ATPase GspE/PulE/Tfp pilus assembly ATPase PilB-like protein